jgi:tetratricopeptide (TPR) repeat protein
VQRGGDAHNSGNLRLALAEYQKAVEISPDYPLAHLNTGITLEGTGALQEAIKSYQQALAALPTIRSFGRGLLETCHPPTHAYTRRHTRARKCTHARKRTPAHVHAQTRLRLQAIFLSPDYPEGYRKLGSIYLRTGGIQHATWHTACHVNQSQRRNVHACNAQARPRRSIGAAVELHRRAGWRKHAIVAPPGALHAAR